MPALKQLELFADDTTAAAPESTETIGDALVAPVEYLAPVEPVAYSLKKPEQITIPEHNEDGIIEVNNSASFYEFDLVAENVSYEALNPSEELAASSKPHILDVVQFEAFELSQDEDPIQVAKTITTASRKVSVILPATEMVVADTQLSKLQLARITQPKKRGRKSIKQLANDAALINVPDDEQLFQKHYYTMGEVCSMFNVNHSLLRYWETEFSILKPRKNRKGDRLFRPEDIKNIEIIYKLTRVKKYTIQGAKDYFKNEKLIGKKFEIINQLEQLKNFLLEVKSKIQ